MLAAEDGITPGQLGYRRDRALAIALSAQLAHATGANGVFCRAGRPGPPGRERRAWRAGGPNGAAPPCGATWPGPTATAAGPSTPPAAPAGTDFFLEYDTGTEDLPRVVAKLAGYRDLAARTGITTPVLFWLPAARREAALRALLASPPPRLPGPRPPARSPACPVATATHSRPAPAARPARSGCPPGSPGPRLRLAQLAAGPRPPPPGRRPAGRRPAAAPAAGLPWHPPAPAPARPARPATRHRAGPRSARQPARRPRLAALAAWRAVTAGPLPAASPRSPPPPHARLHGLRHARAPPARPAASTPAPPRQRRRPRLAVLLPFSPARLAGRRRPGRPVRRRLAHLVLAASPRPPGSPGCAPWPPASCYAALAQAAATPASSPSATPPARPLPRP